MKRARKCLQEEEQIKTEEGGTLDRASTKLELIICPLEAQSTIPDDISILLSLTRVVEVCRYPPRSRKDAQEWGQLWPVQFKPNEVDRLREKGLSEDEMLQVDQGRKELLKLRPSQGDIENSADAVALIMNPENSSVLINSRQATAYVAKTLVPRSSSPSKSLLEWNPLYTTGMILIEGSAAMARGENALLIQGSTFNENDVRDSGSVVPKDQYLLTGLDVYLQQEPDLMTAMAFLHSRVRRIYYLEANRHNGALGSKYVLNDMKELNHRFRVFHLTTTGSPG